MQSTTDWKWDERQFFDALDSLENNGMIERRAGDGFQLTPLGRLGGEAGVAVESLIRVIAMLRQLQPAQINDPTLIAATQLTLELDDVLFPINKRSTQKEPQQWFGEMNRQGVAAPVSYGMRSWVVDSWDATLRAKKAAACLYWITDLPMADIERALTQFGGVFGGAAGPIRAVANRTGDLLDTVGKVAALTHPEGDFSERIARLITRLQLGVSGSVVALAQVLGNFITRGDYQNLLRHKLRTPEDIEKATDDDLKAIFGETEEAARKIAAIREALAKSQDSERRGLAPARVLPPYEP